MEEKTMPVCKICSCCKNKRGNGEKMNDLCILAGCGEAKCIALEGSDKCPLIAKIGKIWESLRDKNGVLQQKLDNCENTKGFQVQTCGGKGNGKDTTWCHWITVMRMKVEYTLTFRLDNYCPDNHFHLRNCLFDNDSGNSCEIRHIGYIQFVETKNQYGKNPTTASFQENGKWLFPDNTNPSTGMVKPLNFCDAPLPLWAGGTPTRHAHILDFFDENGNIKTGMVERLVDAFVAWIEYIERERANC
jgi:hypothetical protein